MGQNQWLHIPGDGPLDMGAAPDSPDDHRYSLVQAAQDYQTIERAIHYLGEHFRHQPTLAEVAAHAGMSEFHFQRLFSRWAGISPKRFLQYLTKEYAREALKRSQSLLDVSLAVGLSGPGRLHDLFVHCEAVTPGEYKNAGEGLTIRYGVHPSPFGQVLLAVTERGICGLSFLASGNGEDERASLRQKWQAATLVEDSEETRRLAMQIFTPGADAAPLHLYVRGTNWQIKVWEALLRIPPGARLTYGDIAQEVCTIKASRAVGNAVGSNPIAYLIPCHRVVRQSGEAHRYRWGSERKQAILAWEAAQA
jgi:AraC family transcriptional regulator, regulatory protein of adaptative response / methylated-DNA-[protein]-cysteine methyltransferase